MAVVGIVGGFLLAFFAVLGIGLVSAASWGREASPQVIQDFGPLLYLMLAIFLLAGAAALWQNFALYHAGDSFQAVAETDVADVDHLADGLDRLRLFFKIQVLVAVVTVVVAFVAGLALVALTERTL